MISQSALKWRTEFMAVKVMEAEEDIMDWDDVRPKAKPSVVVGDNLATLSVGELEDHIRTFESEIERVRAELIKKRAHEAAAAALFKS